MLIAQITDLHIGFDRDNPHELNVRRLNMVIDQLNDLQPRPDMLVVTGDLVENGDDIGAYDHMIALVGRWRGPILWAIGNHDDRANFRAALPQVPVDANGFIQYERDFGGIRWIVIDTLDPGRHGGAFCELRAAWLTERLAERTDEPTIIVLHHPPVDTGIEWMSAEPQEEWVQRLRTAIEPAAQVTAMIAGHVHRPIATSFAGKPLMIAPSTAPWVALDLEPVDPSSSRWACADHRRRAGLCAPPLERRAAADPFRNCRAAQRAGDLRQQSAADDEGVPRGTGYGLAAENRSVRNCWSAVPMRPCQSIESDRKIPVECELAAARVDLGHQQFRFQRLASATDNDPTAIGRERYPVRFFANAQYEAVGDARRRRVR